MIAEKVLRALLKSGDLSVGDSILSVCGGTFERGVFQSVGLTNATISNVDERYDGSLSPYAWSYQDAENLTFADGAFDVCFVHAGLHHCHSPHRALLEMYRVARRVVIVIENRDNAVMRLAVRLGFAAEYEIEAVTANDFKAGGVKNSHIPNFVYRWTEREVLKTVKCFEPRFTHRVRFFYDLRLPTERLERTRQPLRRALVRIGAPMLKLAFKVFPRQANEFGFVIFKDATLLPWLQQQPDGEIAVAPAKVASRMYTPA